MDGVDIAAAIPLAARDTQLLAGGGLPSGAALTARPVPAGRHDAMATRRPKNAWSLAASARLTRDARIAAVRYMRESSAERQWHAAMLAYGHQARTASTGDPAGARALQFATMGYPPPYPEDWDRASAVLLAYEARYLAGADLYVLTPQMLDVVIAAAQTQC
jgi:hypothetical protein